MKRLTLHVSDDLFARVAARAQIERRSMSVMGGLLIEAGLGEGASNSGLTTSAGENEPGAGDAAAPAPKAKKGEK